MVDEEAKYKCDELYYMLLMISNSVSEYKFKYPVLVRNIELMKKNVKICIDAQYDSLSELMKYLQEDWKNIFYKEKNISNCHIECKDIDEKEKRNMEFQYCIQKIDSLLATNIPEVLLLSTRKWYRIQELSEIGKTFETQKNLWETQIHRIKHNYGIKKSPIKLISDEIWTYAKFLCLASDDEKLINWFQQEIPAYGYLIPIEILKLENGDNILKDFLLGTHTLM